MKNAESIKALKLWQALPTETRNVILGNVWCPECGIAVTICDYSMHLNGGAVVLKGFCAACGHKVARFVEGCAPAVKKIKTAAAANLYIFDVWLWGDARGAIKKRIIRKIQIAGTKSLYHFARVITQAFDFYFLAENRNPKPVVLEKVGNAPLQYPPCEDGIGKE